MDERDADTGVVRIISQRFATTALTEALAAVRAEWDAFWTSPLAQTVTAADLPALRRLWLLRDSTVRYQRAIRREPYVLGAKQQPRVNPLAALLMATLAEARQLEDRFGLTPLGRLRLGVTLGDAARSLADLNAEAALDDRDDRDSIALIDTLRKETPR